jgi:AcrR family transcriptional regulator
MTDNVQIMSKVQENKQFKREKLLSSAYSLFIRKGINDTSINDITENADVAKGTFYLYFKDKWDIQNKVIAEKSRLLFDEAIIDTNNKNINNFPDRLINILDYIINSFVENKDLIKLINKNLSMGLYDNNILDEQFGNIKESFENDLKEYNRKIKRPDIILFMIIELVSSCAYNSILNDKPMQIDELKPYLYSEIKKMIG